jgi:predicted Zn-dependent protease
MPKIKFFAVLTLLLAGAAVATRGTPDPTVSLDSLVNLWSDTLRDTDQIGMKLTRVSDAEEMQIGAELARAMGGTEDPAAAAYVSKVAAPLLTHLQRRGIHYQFHVINSDQINAFALPGGQIFVMRGLLDLAESEAEIAGVLGHEMSHVDLRHCIERYQYESKLKKAGMPELGWLVELAHHFATQSFSAAQEAEADTQGERLIIESGYDPDAPAALFLRMKARLGEPSREQQNTPAGEVLQATGNAITAYFRTHPPSEERSKRLADMVTQNHRQLAGRSFYVGKENLRERLARVDRTYPGEYRRID